MGKDLFDFFEKKFSENLSKVGSLQEAFEKTNRDLGFTAYTSYKSFSVQRAKRARSWWAEKKKGG